MIYALYHSETETLGLVGKVLKEKNLSYRETHLFAGEGLPRDISQLAGLIVMGGPMNVDEIEKYPFLFDEVRLIEKILSESKPILGICLGSQLIAKALGSKIYPNKHKEVGWHPIDITPAGSSDPVFSGSPSSLKVFHWHGDTFDLPKDAVHLARSSRCENQAFRWGSNAYGLQFHLEVTPGMVESWVASTDGQKDISSASEKAEKILSETPAAFRTLEPHSNRILNNYLNLAFSHALSAR